MVVMDDPQKVAERVLLDARPVTKPHIRHYEVVSVDPLALGEAVAGIYDNRVETDADAVGRFMLANNIRWCLIRSWDPAWQEPGDEWWPWQWFSGAPSGVSDKFLDHPLSVPDPDRPIGARE